MNEETTTNSVLRQGPLWENPGTAGSLGAFFRTMGDVLLRPRPTFGRMVISPPIGRAYLFYVLPNLGALGVGFVLERMMKGLRALLFVGGEAPSPTVVGLGGSVVVMLTAPFVFAGLVHLLLIVVNGQKYGYAATFRVGAYTGGSVAFFSWIPCVGGCAALIWSVVVEVKGLAAVHETSEGKAAFAVLLSYGLLFAFFLVGGALLVLREGFFPTPRIQV